MSQSQRSRRRPPVSIIVIIVIAIVGFILISPNRLPTFLASIVPGAYSGVPCGSLTSASDREAHQSLLGRTASSSSASPLSLTVASSPVPTNANEYLTITVTMSNDTLGTIPIVYDPAGLAIGDNGSSGTGIIFSPATSLNFNNRSDPPSFPDSQLKLLQPRQRCVQQIQIPAGNVLVEPSFAAGQATVQAYYRNNTQGATVPAPGTLSTPIYPDQGLWVGVVRSAPVSVPLASSPVAS